VQTKIADPIRGAQLLLVHEIDVLLSMPTELSSELPK